MGYQIISCDETELTEENIWTLFDNKCGEALSGEDDYIGIQLRPEMGSGVPLLGWIENWLASFSEKGKTLCIISDDPQQLETMELSHPDQNLTYVSSCKEFEDRVQSSPKIAPKSVVVEQKKPEETVAVKDDIPVTINEQKQETFLAEGAIVDIAGEYICQSCGTTRMWMKGKTATGCLNPECFEPSKGWKLDFDLF